MSSIPPTDPNSGSGTDEAGAKNTPLTIPYVFALGLGGGLGAGVGFGAVMAVVDMMTK